MTSTTRIELIVLIVSMILVVSSGCKAQQHQHQHQQTHNQQLLDKCCIVGRQKAIENAKFNCKLSASEALNITTTIGHQSDDPSVSPYISAGLQFDAMSNLGDQCEMLVESCCMAHHRTRNCDSGKQFARSGSGCMDVELSKEATLATESFNDCCMACSLGILAAQTPSDQSAFTTANDSQSRRKALTDRCKLISPLASSLSGQLYERAYIECCQQSLPKSAALIVPGTTISCSQGNSCAQRCLESGTYDPITRRTLDQDECGCFSGYRLAHDGYNCHDIDECETNQHSCNKQLEICDNTKGGYRCLARQLPHIRH